MKRLLIVIMVLLYFGHISEAAEDQATPAIPAPPNITTWVQALKCRDLIRGQNEVNQNVFAPFTIWLHGYAAGLGSALPLDLLPAGSFHFFEWINPTQFDALILTSCSKRMEASAVETAIDAASLIVNAISKKNVLLRGTDGKWE